MARTLHIDFESKSTVDLRATGVYVYASDPTTDVWCAAYAVDDEPVQLWTPDQPTPEAFVRAATLRGWTLVAHNANFEMTMIERLLGPRYGWPVPEIGKWRCTMAQALAMALPGSLAEAAKAVGLDIVKDMTGRDQMLRMSKPRRPRKGELPGQTYWFDDAARLERLYAYCRQDVEVERALDRRLLALRPAEQKLWHLDQVINARGVYVDRELCHAAKRIADESAKWLNDELCELTGGAAKKTTNVADITQWLIGEGVYASKLDKEAVGEMLARPDLSPAARRVLEIRQEAAKAAVKKIDALLKGCNEDGRARGLLQFHSASTGRWAGRRFQPQNIARPKLEDVDSAIDLVGQGDAAAVQMVYGEPLAVVSDCLRGMIRAAPGNRLYAADFSNIEGRVQAWVAGEHWKLAAFRDFDAGRGPDLYKVAYSRSFGIPTSEVDKDQRQVGKVMELALGYQGGVGAFQKMAAVYRVTVSDERADELKVAWREAHPNIVECWYDLENAAKAAIQNRGKVFTAGPVAFRVAGSFMFMRLPSGRSICYPYPCIVEKAVPWGGTRPTVSYKGLDSYTRQWTDCFAHGGLLFNNVVQGIARDIEAEAMMRVEEAGYWNVLSVHDEVVSEVPEDFGSVEEFERLMTTLPDWAKGLPVAAGAWTAERYRK